MAILEVNFHFHITNHHQLMNTPLVTVSLAVYNVEKFLRRSMDCICNQTYSNLEILCVNDGSTDDSLSILEEYAAKDSRVRIISKPNGGLASARNVGIDNATGKYIQMLDSDDIFETDMVEKLVNAAEKQQAEIVVCDTVAEIEGSNKLIFNRHHNTPLSRKHLRHDLCCPRTDAPEHLFQIFCAGVVWNKLFLLEFINKNKFRLPLPPAGDDLAFTYKALISADRVSIVESRLIRYQIRKDSLSHKGNHNLDATPINMRELDEFMSKREVDEALRQSFFVRCAKTFFWNIHRVPVSVEKIAAHLDKWIPQLRNMSKLEYTRKIIDSSLCAFEAIFFPEIQLIIPQIDCEKKAELVAKLQGLVSPICSPQLATRILYATSDAAPIPELDFPIALPISVNRTATFEERLAACTALPIPAAPVTLWPGCNPTPVKKLLLLHKKELICHYIKRTLTFSSRTKESEIIKKRILRARIKNLEVLLDIIQSYLPPYE